MLLALQAVTDTPVSAICMYIQIVDVGVSAIFLEQLSVSRENKLKFSENT